jgi:tetratricopeptide (TPR) repeat protein
MKVRRVSFAFVSAAFLAAFATNGSSALANSSSAQLSLTRDAYQALQAGDADAAIASYTQAINSRKLEREVLANALLNRALAYQQKSADEQAIADYTQALALDAMSPSLRATALYNRGLSRQKTRNLPAAVEDFTASLLLNPEFAHAYYGRATALRESGQLLFALSDYERALSHKHPDVAKVNYGLAVTFIALRRPADARKALAEVLQAKPDHEGALAEMAKLNTSENAQIDETEADPILTGSIAAISGGTSVSKAMMPKAVDVPEELQQSATPVAKKAKKIVDRVPLLETASYTPETQSASLDQNKGVTIDEVPAIPAPVKAKTKAKAAAAPAEPVAEPGPETATAEPAAAPEATEEAAAEAAVQTSGYMVQIASAASEEAAWSTWKKMQKRNKALQSLKPIVVKADLGTKGVFYRVRLQGFEDQNGAKAACSKLKANGVSCFVSKT